MADGDDSRNRYSRDLLEDFDISLTKTDIRPYKQIYPDKVRGHAREILDGVPRDKHDYNYVARFTEYLYETVEYRLNSDIWRPDFLLEHTQEGDCEDISICLTSLLHARSVDTRYVLVLRPGSDLYHVMVQALFEDASLEYLVERAEAFYDCEIGTLAWERTESGGYWVICDPVHTPVAGRISPEFCRTTPDGEIEWKSEVLVDYVEV